MVQLLQLIVQHLEEVHLRTGCGHHKCYHSSYIANKIKIYSDTTALVSLHQSARLCATYCVGVWCDPMRQDMCRIHRALCSSRSYRSRVPSAYTPHDNTRRQPPPVLLCGGSHQPQSPGRPASQAHPAAVPPAANHTPSDLESSRQSPPAAGLPGTIPAGTK